MPHGAFAFYPFRFMPPIFELNFRTQLAGFKDRFDWKLGTFHVSGSAWSTKLDYLCSFGLLVQFVGFQKVVGLASQIRSESIHANEPQLTGGLDTFLEDQEVAYGETAPGARRRMLRAERLDHS